MAARVLAISSQVVRGHVGLSAIVPALQGLGHEVWPLPTVILSNHPGHARTAGTRIDPAVLARMLDTLDQNGWLPEIDAIITGYLPSAEHVRVAADLVKRLRAKRNIFYLCDPVLGDEPKGLYIDAMAAAAIRDDLIPLADFATPNVFELGWLTGSAATTLPEIEGAARRLSCPGRLVTSVKESAGKIGNLLLGPGRWLCEVTQRPSVPHGTGDFVGALFLGHLLNGVGEREALGRTTAGVEVAIRASGSHDELQLAASAADWIGAAALPSRDW